MIQPLVNCIVTDAVVSAKAKCWASVTSVRWSELDAGRSPISFSREDHVLSYSVALATKRCCLHEMSYGDACPVCKALITFGCRHITVSYFKEYLIATRNWSSTQVINKYVRDMQNAICKNWCILVAFSTNFASNLNLELPRVVKNHS